MTAGPRDHHKPTSISATPSLLWTLNSCLGEKCGKCDNSEIQFAKSTCSEMWIVELPHLTLHGNSTWIVEPARRSRISANAVHTKVGLPRLLARPLPTPVTSLTHRQSPLTQCSHQCCAHMARTAALLKPTPYPKMARADAVAPPSLSIVFKDFFPQKIFQKKIQIFMETFL